MGASCYQSSDLAPHYGDMRSAATTGNRFIMIHCDGNHDGDDYGDVIIIMMILIVIIMM